MQPIFETNLKDDGVLSCIRLFVFFLLMDSFFSSLKGFVFTSVNLSIEII